MLKVLKKHFVYFSLPPLFWITLACIGGIIGKAYSPSVFLHFLFALLIAATFCLYLFCKCSLQTVVTSCLVYTVFLFAGWHYERIIAQHTTFYTTFVNKPVSCTAYVCSCETTANRFKHAVTITTQTIKYDNKTVPARYTIKMHLLYKPQFYVGDTIHVKNLVIKPVTNHSFENYLIKEGVIATLFLPKIDYTLIKHPGYSFNRFLAHTRQRVTENILKKMSKQTGALFSSIFLGTKPADTHMLERIKEQFTQWGIVHYLARSGLHVILIVLLWAMLLRLIPLPFFVKQCIMLFLIVLYHILTWPSISFMRALITFVLYRLCALRTLPAHPLALLSITTLAVLLYNPLELFFLDFQLSFGLTAALAWFSELSAQHKLYAETVLS